MMKHNNMRDDDAKHAYEKTQKELLKHADNMDADFWRWVDTLVDARRTSESIEDKGTLTIVQTDGHFTIGEDDRLRPSPPNPIDSVPDDSYKLRYEEAIKLMRRMTGNYNTVLGRYDEAMELLDDVLQIASDFSPHLNRAAYKNVQHLIKQRDKLRDMNNIHTR